MSDEELTSVELAVDNSAWDGNRAMGMCSSASDYRSICAGEHSVGNPDERQHWALPHHFLGQGPNADGVRNAQSRLPQTQDLTNRSAAEAHLQAHMDQIHAAEGQQSTEHEHDLARVKALEEHILGEEVPAIHRTLDVNEPLISLSVSERRLGLRLLTYNTVVESKYGPILFEPGAFGNVDAKAVRLRMDHQDPPTGLGTSFTDTPQAPLMDFLVSKTERGNDQLTLAVDGVSRGVSVGFDDVPGGPKTKTIDGRRVIVYPPASAHLAEVSTTWTPTFPQPLAGVLYALNQGEKGEAPVAETQEAPVVGAALDYEKLTAAIVAAQANNERSEKIDKVLEKFEQTIELQRAQFTIPSAPAKPKAKLHHWVEFTLRRMRGENMSSGDLKRLALDDVVISEQPGLVPDLFTADYDDLINQDRPFLNSTRRISAPVSGDTLTLPVITTRAVAGTQSEEKGVLTTTATKVGTGTFNYQSVFGGADLSIQFINRAQPGFFEILTGDMAMAYALDAEAKAIDALLTGYTDSASGSHVPDDGGVLDPEDPHFGDAWITSITSGFKRAPTHIWMSAAAVGAFIDAKAPATNAPLYSNLAAAFTAGGGAGGALSGLTPIYVPALDSSGVDVIIGPARGFVWAEDPALTLQADVPSIAGRDIALAGGIFPAPRYADAFTYYTVSS